MDDGRVFFPEGWSMRDVEVVSSGYPRGGVGALPFRGVKTKVTEIGGAQIKKELDMSDSRWSAVINQAGDGWIAANACEVVEGPSKGVLLIPMVSRIIDKQYSIIASSAGDSATCTIAVQGPAICFEVRSTAKSKARGYKVRVTGKIDDIYNWVNVFHCKDSRAFTFISQPSRPVVLVTHRKNFSAPVTFFCLRKAGIVSDAVVGGFGKGTLKVELAFDLFLHRDEVFTSEAIAVE